MAVSQQRDRAPTATRRARLGTSPAAWVFALVLAGAACDRDDAAAAAAEPAGTSQGSATAAALETEQPPAQPAGEPSAAADAPSWQATSRRQEELRGAAMSALGQGQTDLAIAALIGLSETPEMSDLRASGDLLLAELYLSEGNGERSVGILQALIAEAPPMPEFEFLLGRTLSEMGQPNDALPHFQRAIEIGPQLLQSYIFLGGTLVGLDREDEAADVYLQYERVLGAMLERLGQPSTPLQERLALVELISTANPDQRITEVLLTMLGEEQVVANAAAIQTLAQVGTPDAVPALTAYAESTPHVELADAARQAVLLIESR